MRDFYIRQYMAFLAELTPTLGFKPLHSDGFRTPVKGTMQGSVMSPLLFNVTYLMLPPLLQTIPGIHHALDEDDLTFSTPTARLAHKIHSHSLSTPS